MRYSEQRAQWEHTDQAEASGFAIQPEDMPPSIRQTLKYTADVCEQALTDMRAARAEVERLRAALEGYREENRRLREFLSDGRAGRLRLVLFQLRDCREATSAAGYVLTETAKAKLYDMQQDAIRAAIAEDDAALAPKETP